MSTKPKAQSKAPETEPEATQVQPQPKPQEKVLNLQHLLPQVETKESKVEGVYATDLAELPMVIPIRRVKVDYKEPIPVMYEAAKNAPLRPGVGLFTVYAEVQTKSTAMQTFGQWQTRVNAEVWGYKQALLDNQTPMFETVNDEKIPVLITKNEAGEDIDPVMLLSFGIELGQNPNTDASKRLTTDDVPYCKPGLSCPRKKRTQVSQQGKEYIADSSYIDWNPNTGLEDTIMHPLFFAKELGNQDLIEIFNAIPEGPTSVANRRKRAEAEAGYSNMVTEGGVSGTAFPGSPDAETPENANASGDTDTELAPGE